MKPEQVFEEMVNLLDDEKVKSDDALKICTAICIGVCIDLGQPKMTYMSYMSEAWDWFSKQREKDSNICH